MGKGKIGAQCAHAAVGVLQSSQRTQCMMSNPASIHDGLASQPAHYAQAILSQKLRSETVPAVMSCRVWH
eukprot:1161001-Pelagomonas_calceolata.AAC.8